MITSVSIERLRGIKQGELTDLTPLTVLLGPNGCGKSTVLDAMLIASGLRPAESVARAVMRHQGVQYPAPWLLWKRGWEGSAMVVSRDSDGFSTLLQVAGEVSPAGGGMPELRVHAERLLSSVDCTVRFPGPGQCEPSREPFGRGVQVAPVRLVDPAVESGQVPLDDLLTEVMTARGEGRAREMIALVTRPDAQLRILTEMGEPILHLTTDDGSVPVALSGEGVRSMTRTVLELEVARDGTLLLEEPEVHQHPATMALCARAIVAGVARGVQVVVSTHSLELVDDLIEACGEEHLDKLSVYNLKLSDGILSSTRRTGDEAKFAREGMEWDLR